MTSLSLSRARSIPLSLFSRRYHLLYTPLWWIIVYLPLAVVVLPAVIIQTVFSCQKWRVCESIQHKWNAFFGWTKSIAVNK